MIYLATPYSHPDPAVRQARFDAVNRVAAELIQTGAHVFSPISQSHPIALIGDLPTSWEYWESYDKAILSICDQLNVLMLPGWYESVGVAAEIRIAEELGIPVVLMVPKS